MENEATDRNYLKVIIFTRGKKELPNMRSQVYRPKIRGMILFLVLILISSEREICSAQETKEQVPFLKIGVKLGDVSLNKLPFMMAQDHEIYHRNGLEVSQYITASAANIARNSGITVSDQLILNEEATPYLPVLVGGCSPVMVQLTTIQGAVDPIIIACTDQIIRVHIIAKPKITAVDQLKGKRIGFTGIGSTTHFAALSFCSALGWDPVHDVSLLSGGRKMAGLEHDYIDAFIGSEMHETMAVAAGYRDLVDLSQYNMPNAGSSVWVDRVWLKNNREAASRFVKSLVEAIALLKSDKSAAVASMEKWLGLSDTDLQDYFYEKVDSVPSKPYPPYEGVKKVMEFYDSHEMRKYSPEYFYDDSFILLLDESGFIDSLYN